MVFVSFVSFCSLCGVVATGEGQGAKDDREGERERESKSC